jgi:uncharacterized integral membrane protein
MSSAEQPPDTPDRPVPVPPPAGAAAPGATTPPVPAPPAPAKEDRPSTWQPLLYLRIGVLGLAIAYAIAFVVQNNRQIKIDFVFGTARVSLIWEILLLLGVGLVGGMLLSQLYRHRRRVQLAKKAGQQRRPGADVGGGHEAVRKPS